MKRFLLVFVFVLAGVVNAQEAEPLLYRDSIPATDSIQLEPVVTNLIRPLYVTHAGDGSGRLFIVEQRGRINIWDGSELSIFMDISNLVSQEALGTSYTERGLLGLAFHPDYAENGTFFVNYTDRDGATVVTRYQVSANPDVADTGSAEVILTVNQPYRNHNGGHMAFDADGYLYISLGDGGSAGDPLNAGQNPATLLGTIIRIDVNTEAGYVIPPDNPFVTSSGANEVWAYGLRNVWRFSFDRATDDMYLGDVGQAQWEEVNFEPADSPGGVNYGWNFFEASRIYEPGGNPMKVSCPLQNIITREEVAVSLPDMFIVVRCSRIGTVFSFTGITVPVKCGQHIVAMRIHGFLIPYLILNSRLAVLAKTKQVNSMSSITVARF